MPIEKNHVNLIASDTYGKFTQGGMVPINGHRQANSTNKTGSVSSIMPTRTRLGSDARPVDTSAALRRTTAEPHDGCELFFKNKNCVSPGEISLFVRSIAHQSV